MGLLDAEAVERMGPVLEQALGGAPPEPPAPAPAPPEPAAQAAPEPSSPAPDVNPSANVETDATPAAAPSSDQAESFEGHNVPYGRFKQVLEARNKHREEVALMRSRLADLEAKQASFLQQAAPAPQPSPVQSPGETHWLDELSGEAQPQQPAETAVDPRLHALASQIETQGVQLQKMQLEREVAEAMQSYPGVDRHQLLQGVYHNPSASVMELAEQYSTFVASVEERAIARYLKDNPQAAEALAQEVASAQETAPQAPPRPSRTSAGGQQIVWPESGPPKNVEEGSKMLREFFKQHNPFA